MTDVKGDYPDHVLSLLGLVLDGIRREMSMVTREWSGHAGAAQGLRSSQVRMLSLTPAEGMTVTALAERVGMTKQALGEFANDLEARGLLESGRDPADRRVRILRPTPTGLAAVADAERLIGEVEQRWRDRLGSDDWDRLRDLLTRAHNSRPDLPS